MWCCSSQGLEISPFSTQVLASASKCLTIILRTDGFEEVLIVVTMKSTFFGMLHYIAWLRRLTVETVKSCEPAAWLTLILNMEAEKSLKNWVNLHRTKGHNIPNGRTSQNRTNLTSIVERNRSGTFLDRSCTVTFYPVPWVILLHWVLNSSSLN
jgi:hypothetical protein